MQFLSNSVASATLRELDKGLGLGGLQRGDSY